MNHAFRPIAFRSILFVFLVLAGFVAAEEPPKPLPLAEKVAKASHIFVGTPSRVSIEFKDPFYAVDMTLKVDEALLPQKWNPGKVIHMHLLVDLLNDQVVDLLVMFKNKQQLFILMQPWSDSKGKPSADFTGSADYNQIAVPMTDRARVEEELKKRNGKAKTSP